MVGQQRALVEVDTGLGGGAGDVGVRGKVDNGVGARYRPGERVEVLDVVLYDGQPRVARMGGQMPSAARGEVVVDGDRLHPWVGKEAINDVCADEAGASDNGEAPGAADGLGQGIDSHLVLLTCNVGCETRRCQTTAQSPSVWGVMRWSNSGGITMQASATSRV